jgi:uncharacterized protein (DUF1330 family)
MNPHLRIVLTAAGGIVVGALCATVSHAQKERPHAFLIADIADVTDPAMLKQYQAAAPAVNAAFGGHVLARGTAVGVDSKSPPPDGTIVVVEFPDIEHLHAWYDSPAYAKIKPLREQSSTTHLYAVEGLPPL